MNRILNRKLEELSHRWWFMFCRYCFTAQIIEGVYVRDRSCIYCRRAKCVSIEPIAKPVRLEEERYIDLVKGV